MLGPVDTNSGSFAGLLGGDASPRKSLDERMDYQSAIRMYVQPGRSQQEKEELGRRVKELTGYVALPHGRQAKYTDRANRAVFRSMAQELTQSGALQKKSNESLQVR